MNHIVIVYGATGVGKTDFVDLLAQKMSIEIVNMDMGQLYTPLTIGTAKPLWRASQTPHHLFDIIDTPTNFTVVAYRKKVLEVIQSIWSRGKLPVLVGGSGFYLKSLFFAPAVPEVQEAVVCEYDFAECQTDSLWRRLQEIDPVRAGQIAITDRYRIERALSIWYSTKKKPSEYTVQCEPIAPFSLFFLQRDRQVLYDRINQRVGQMIDDGWVQEVESLQGNEWEQFLYEKKIIGYDDLLRYLRGSTDKNLAETCTTIQKRTRQYAKRQYTFWRMLQRQLSAHLFTQKTAYTTTSHIESLDLSLLKIDLYIKLLSERLKK